MTKYILGVDIGGTTVKIGIITVDGDIKHKWEISTNTDHQGIFIVQDIWDSIKQRLAREKMSNTNILGIGVGAPGFLNDETGLVYEAVNIGWKNFNLGKSLSELSNLPVVVGNDANIAALGENWKGAGNRSKNMIAVTLGTGVGGGIIANGKVLTGENGVAGEIGHITVEPNGVPCNCGRRGCLETIASATGIVRKAMIQLQKEPDGKLAKRYEENQGLTSKDVFEMAMDGDSACLEIIKDMTDALGFVIANIAIVINPAKILIGGGVSKAGEPLIKMIEEAFDHYALPRVSNICEITHAKLGNDAGIIGAAFLVQQQLLNVEF